MGVKVTLSKVRIAFPRLWVAEQYQNQGAFNYSAKFIIEPNSANHKAINAAILEALKTKWPTKVDAMLEEFKSDKKAFPFINGDRVDWDGAEGKWVLTAKRKQTDGKPTVVDRNREPLAPDSGLPYAGCYVNANVEFWAQDNVNKGVRCTLRGVQFAADGEAFGASRAASEDEFEDLSEDEDLLG